MRSQDNNATEDVERLIINTEEEQVLTPEEEDVQDVAWLKRRKHTTYLVYSYALIFGCEYSAIVLTLYFYLERTVKTEHIQVYFSLGMGAMAIMASVSGLLCGHYVDKTRHIRRLVLLCIPVTIIGNVLYCIHFSVWFVVVGRLLCGVGDAINSALTGELSRVYSQEELVKVMYNFQSIYTLGFVLGPAVNILFLKVNIHLGTWILNQYNFIGIFLAIVLMMYYVLVYLFLHDLSAQTDGQIPRVSESEREAASLRHAEEPVWKSILTSLPIVMLIFSSSFNNFISVVTELIVPILSNTVFHWTIQTLSIVTTVCVVVFAVAMVVVGRLSLVTTNRIFGMYVTCFAGLCVSMSLLTLPAYLMVSYMKEQVVLVAVVTLINSCCGLMSVALAKTMYLTLVPAERASLYEGIRCVAYRVFGMTGFLSASFIFPYLCVVGPCTVIFLFVFLLFFCVRRDYFSGNYDYSRISD